MESLDKWVMVLLKDYVGNMESKFKDYTLKLPDRPKLRSLFYRQLDKCKRGWDNNYFYLYFKVGNSRGTLSAHTEPELEMKFFSFLVNY